MARISRRTKFILYVAGYLLIFIAYPLGFLAWYGTADRVIVRIDHCKLDARQPKCYGSWTLSNGTTVTGRMYGAEKEDDGKAIPARGGRYWAIAEGRRGPWIIPMSFLVIEGLVLPPLAALRIASIRRRTRQAGPTQ